MLLPDVLTPGLRVVIAGTAAGTKSAAAGYYYAHPGNQFWAVLARCGLTPRRLEPSEFQTLPTYGIGLTDLVQDRAGADKLTMKGRVGTQAFIRRIEEAAPAVLAFNGKLAAETVLRRKVGYGAQPERIAGAAVWVLPSTSGAARGAWDETVWQAFARAVSRPARRRSRRR